MAFNAKNREIGITFIAFAVLLFALTNINQTLGNVYLWFSIGIFLLILFDDKLTITYQRSPGGNLKAVMWGALGYISLLMVSSVVLNVVQPGSASIGSVVRSIGASTPALSQSVFANFILLAFFIPFMETQLWARAMEFIADKFNIKPTRQNITSVSVITLILIFSAIFVIFHLTAKGIASTSSLLIVFVMMVISLILVVIFEETRPAVFMHMMANGVAAWLLLQSGAAFT